MKITRCSNKADKKIYVCDVVKELKSSTKLEIGDDVLAEILKFDKDPNYCEGFIRWGGEHYEIVRSAIGLQSQRKNCSMSYLNSLKVNYQQLTDNQLINGLISFIGMVVTIILAFVKNPINRTGLALFLFALFFVVFVRWVTLATEARYSYKNNFYKHVIDTVIAEAESVRNKTEEYEQ